MNVSHVAGGFFAWADYRNSKFTSRISASDSKHFVLRCKRLVRMSTWHCQALSFVYGIDLCKRKRNAFFKFMIRSSAVTSKNKLFFQKRKKINKVLYFRFWATRESLHRCKLLRCCHSLLLVPTLKSKSRNGRKARAIEIENNSTSVWHTLRVKLIMS